MKTISILIPVYNTEKYIKRCMDSILLDDILGDIEIILVNDGSKDDSLKIMNEYKKQYSKSVVVIDKENGGHGSTINAGLKIATGKYFRVIDSDDWVNSKHFVEFVKRLRDENVDAVITNYNRETVSNRMSEVIEWKKLEENETYNFDKFNLELLDKEYFVMANTTYKTEVLKNAKLNLMEKTFYVDMQYNVIPILHVKNFKYWNLNIYRYFLGRPDQTMNLQNLVRNRANHEKVMKFLIEYYTENLGRFSENKKAYIKQILFYMLTTHYYIYCVYPKKDKKKICKEIKKFDKYLKGINAELYSIMDEISQIKYNRKTKFIFVKINPQFFSKLISKCGNMQRKMRSE